MLKQKKDKKALQGMNDVKIIHLGGVDGIGSSNCTVVEYKNKIFVIDMGLSFPDPDMYGVDFIIPNIEYLKKNKSKIQGIFITHAHLDHIGAIGYVLKDLGNPKIYATRFSIEIIKSNLGRNHPNCKPTFVEINSDKSLYFGGVRVGFFRVNHSIPEAVGITISTKLGNVIFTGDFKFDNSPNIEPVAEYAKIAQLGSSGALALFSDSTNSFKPGHSLSEQKILVHLQDIIEAAEGRVIVATFSSLVFRILQLIQIAKNTNRKVCIAGFSMKKVIEISQRLGYVKNLKDVLVSTSQMKTLPKSRCLIIATGAQGEETSALPKIAAGKHKDISIKSGDSVILSASVIPGNDFDVQNLVDKLSIQGAIVHHSPEDMNLHTSGHGYQEDQKIMLNLVKPKYFIPVHGYKSFLYKHAQTAESVGIDKKNIIIPNVGEIITFNGKGYTITKGKIKSEPVLVSGSGIGDVGEIVLKERTQLGDNGVILLSSVINRNEKKLVDRPILISKGFTFFNDNKKLFNDLTNLSIDILEKSLTDGKSTKEIKDSIKKELSKKVLKEIDREPLIFVVVHEI